MIKQLIRIFHRFFLLHFKSALEYKKAFFIQVFGMMINNASFLIFWVFLFDRFSTPFAEKNIAFSNIALLWALASSGFGFTHIFLKGARDLSDHIINGRLDMYLVYPAPVLYVTLLSRSSNSGWGDLLYGYIMVVLFLPKSAVVLLLFTYFIIISGIILASFLIILNSLSFYWGNTEDIAETLFNATITFETYPEGIFSGFIKFILFSVLPVGFAIYIPVRVILQFDLALFLMATGIAFVFAGLAVFVFYRGLKHYESGNIFYSNK